MTGIGREATGRFDPGTLMQAVTCDWPGRPKWLAERGYREVDEGFYDELSAEAINADD